jgi:DNA-directed RNA polymerase subunit RPC12/RpoP
MTHGTCPVCNGSGRVPVPANQQRYKHVYSGYDAETDTLACSNCGGQYMYGRPTGKVRLNKAGEPCQHSYSGRTVGRCLTRYTCSECGDSYEIDSGD